MLVHHNTNERGAETPISKKGEIYKRNPGKKDELRSQPVIGQWSTDYVEAMQQIAATSRFGVQVEILAVSGEEYTPQDGRGKAVVAEGRTRIAIRGGDTKEGLTLFYRAAKSFKRHSKKQGNRQG